MRPVAIPWFSTILLVGLLPIAGATGQEPKASPLWPEGAPGALGAETGTPNNPGDVPTITVWLPPKDKATGAAVVICPGGGYGNLAVDHEGKRVAEWLNSIGVAGVMLRYRLGPKYRHPVPLQDAQRAIRTVRARAGDWGIDRARVGILGFSAGGHLASTAGTHFDAGTPDASDPIDRQSSRPDFLLLAYPVVALATPHAHAGSRRNLLGDTPDPAVLAGLSNETQVTKETPPTFVVHTAEDTSVVPENSILFVEALRKAGVPCEFHLFERGRHGLGLGGGLPERNIPADPAFSAWPRLCEAWLRGRGLLGR